jgi:ABC-2 type transport system permease protein
MNAKNTDWRESARILWAITAKDLVEALKNKNTVFLIVFGVLMLVFYREYPALTSRGEPPNVLVYDAGNSALVAYLENSQALEVYTGYQSEAQMKEKLANGEVPELGLVIPADFDQIIEAGGAPELQGYVMNWVNEDDAAGLQRTVEAEIAQLVGTPVGIRMQDDLVYPMPDSGGLGVTAGFGFVYIITTLGLIMIPYLMLEEKQSHTIDALLVSPASEGQVVMGKALTGLFYCLVGAGVALAVFYNLMVHWWLAVLAVLFGSLFTVSTGLLLGTAIENRGQLTLLAWLFIIPLFLPVFLSLMDDLLPATLIQVFRILPTVVMFNLLRTSFSGAVPLGTSLLQLTWVAACAGGVLLLVAWLVQRRDREGEGISALWRLASERLAPAANGGLQTFSPLLKGLTHRRPSQGERILLVREVTRVEADIHMKGATSNAGLRIIWAIAAKDIGTAIKNKIMLSIILGTALVVLNGSVLPMLLGLRNTPTAIVYDEGRSTIVRALTAREDFRLRLVDSREDMEAAVSGAPETRLGVVIPADFDQRAGSGQIIELEGYTAHWADPEKVSQWVALFEKELGLASWGTVRIDTEGNVLYPTVDTGGQLSLTSLMIVIVILTIGMALVPLLFIEEKEAHTFEALLVSPASLGQVVAGKALAGGFYCFVASVVVLLLNRYLVVHWGVALLAVLLAAAFAVALGLVVGFLSDTPATTGLWGGLLIVILVVLTGLQAFKSPDWPQFVQALLDWQPGSAMIEMFRISMAGEAPLGLLWANAAALLAVAALIYALILGLLRRAGR